MDDKTGGGTDTPETPTGGSGGTNVEKGDIVPPGTTTPGPIDQGDGGGNIPETNTEGSDR